jgi:hypothetical protein
VFAGLLPRTTSSAHGKLKPMIAEVSTLSQIARPLSGAALGRATESCSDLAGSPTIAHLGLGEDGRLLCADG